MKNSRDVDSKENKVLFFSCNPKPLRFILSSVAENEMSQAAAILGRKGGKARTKAKIKAVRENGKKGGRPRKKRKAA